MNVSALFVDIDFLAASNSVSYLTGAKMRNINIAYQDVARLIWESAGGWQYDDSNAVDLPFATTTLVHNQNDYELPTTIQRLERVEAMDSSGNYILLKQYDLSDFVLATTETFASPGMPIYYDVVGRSLMLYPTPSSAYVTLTQGLKGYFQRDVANLSATTATPGFPLAFHRILSCAAALDYTKDDETRLKLQTMRDRLEKGLVRFYGKRNVEGKTRIKPAGKRRWRQYT